MEIRLFGRLTALHNNQGVNFSAQKSEELLSYLLLHRGRPHSREVLATLLWSECSTAASKAYLRRTLWTLKKDFANADSEDVLLVDGNWISVNPEIDLVLDVAVLEEAERSVRGIPGALLTEEDAHVLGGAVQVYAADLLENCYADWCLIARERLKQIYLTLLDKLMVYCEHHGDYDRGVEYSRRILKVDSAREHTHRQLMRLLYLSGNRTGAIRQFERCRTFLADELGVKPSNATLELYEHICAADLSSGESRNGDHSMLMRRLSQVRDVHQRIAELQNHLCQEIAALEQEVHSVGTSTPI